MKRKTKKAYTARHIGRMGTARMRTLPDFVIIGAQKGGTTFLYRLLAQHPRVKPAFLKEVHYFDLNFERGENWYRSQFPFQLSKSQKHVTGESSPYYLFHPHAPRRAAEVIPGARLIVLLRNPVDRAYSHYNHQSKRVKGAGRETLTFEGAIEAEEKRLDGELEKLLHDEHYDSLNYRRYSYLSRGAYVDQLLAWSEFFDRDQMLVLKSEDLFSNPAQSLKATLGFLGLSQWTPETHPSTYKLDYVDMNPATRHDLQDYFEPHNQRLYKYLGVDFGW